MERPANKIRLLLVDDHPVVRRGIQSCLAKYRHLEVVGEAADGRQAIAQAKALSPDIILLDIGLPGMDGVMAMETLKKEAPSAKVLILSMQHNKDAIMRLIQSGVRGYLSKEAAPEEIARAIDTIQSGEVYFSQDIARIALNQYVANAGQSPASPASKLTERERQVLAHIAEGLTNKEVASKLNISVRTIETHRERIMRKLEIRNAAGLTKFAIAHGIVTLER